MRQDSLEALKFIKESKTPPTVKVFTKHFAPNGEELLQTILVSHVDEVKGKLTINEAGVWLLTHFGENNG